MKKLLFLFLIISQYSIAQISGSCTTCPPSGVGNSGKYLKSDGSKKAVYATISGLDTNAVNIDSLAYWKLSGNSGTNPTINYLGTSDNQPLSIRQNGNQVISLDSNNLTLIGRSTLDTLSAAVVGNLSEVPAGLNGGYSKASGFVNSDFATYGNYSLLTRDGHLIGNIGGSKYLLPKSDGTANTYLRTNGTGQASWDSLRYSYIAGAPATIQATNGLNLNGSYQLGGSLTDTTEIDLGNYPLEFTNNVFQSSIPLFDNSGYMAIRTDTGVIGSYIGYFRTNNPFGGAYMQIYPFNASNYNVNSIRWILANNSVLDSTHNFGISAFDDNINMFQFNRTGSVDVAQVNIRLHKSNMWSHGIDTLGGLVQVDSNYVYLSYREKHEQKLSAISYEQDSTGHYFKGAVRIADGTQGAGKVLTSDASGNSVWGALGSGNFSTIPSYADNTSAFAVLGPGKLYYTNTGGEYILKVTH